MYQVIKGTVGKTGVGGVVDLDPEYGAKLEAKGLVVNIGEVEPTIETEEPDGDNPTGSTGGSDLPPANPVDKNAPKGKKKTGAKTDGDNPTGSTEGSDLPPANPVKVEGGE